VTTGKLGDGAVTTSKLGADAVDATKLGDSAVTPQKLAADSVDSGKLAAGSVTKGKVAASGSTSNASTYNLVAGSCTEDTTIPATGAQPGDAISYGVRVGAAVGGLVSVAPAGNTVSNGKFQVEVCNHVNTATVAPGRITLDWIAVR
jgi:hypothetical protein